VYGPYSEYEPYYGEVERDYYPAMARINEFARMLDLNGDSKITEDELY
jgi:hypothetical protein